MQSRILTTVLMALCAFSAVVAQTRVDTLQDRRVKMYLTDRRSLIPADDVVVPEPLAEGDLIAILTPAADASNYDYKRMAEIIESMGYRCRVMPNADSRDGYYGGTVEERMSDMREALLDPDVKAIICSRGGYGVVHLLAGLDSLPIADNPKWVVGFSDISALHSFMVSHGIASIHGPMGVNLKYHDGELSASCKALFDILSGSHATYEIEPHCYNRNGEVIGKLVGGNLSVIAGLISTPFDVIKPGTVLLIEDVSEPVYKIQRMLYQLKLSGVLENLAGLIVGDFTEIQGDSEKAMESMIRDMISEYDYPVAFGVPAGHARVNIPLIMGYPVLLSVDDEGTTIFQ
ncbi:MAG: LD-carboxypeptidase [Bacteroides sp.]|nr:LD-carboxypeptidase [Bacteroides sp.]MCM1413814.1 LD-carboxypeptidase [Bacteroides sp.]MCM1471242.1 LD-carboxypeptidase [Bacteroides sp.]